MIQLLRSTLLSIEESFPKSWSSVQMRPAALRKPWKWLHDVFCPENINMLKNALLWHHVKIPRWGTSSSGFVTTFFTCALHKPWSKEDASLLVAPGSLCYSFFLESCSRRWCVTPSCGYKFHLQAFHHLPFIFALLVQFTKTNGDSSHGSPVRLKQAYIYVMTIRSG